MWATIAPAAETLGGEGWTRISDFGLARLGEDTAAAGEIAGTPAYTWLGFVFGCQAFAFVAGAHHAGTFAIETNVLIHAAAWGLYYATAGRPFGRWKPLEL